MLSVPTTAVAMYEEIGQRFGLTVSPGLEESERL